MPPLDEGELLYMPSTMPGISIAEAQRLLQITDRIIKQFPEVDRSEGEGGARILGFRLLLRLRDFRGWGDIYWARSRTLEYLSGRCRGAEFLYDEHGLPILDTSSLAAISSMNPKPANSRRSFMTRIIA